MRLRRDTGKSHAFIFAVSRSWLVDDAIVVKKDLRALMFPSTSTYPQFIRIQL